MTNFLFKKSFNMFVGLLLFFLSTSLIIGIGEISLRLLDTTNEIETDENWYAKNYTVNSWGHRSNQEYMLKKPEGEFRVLVLGDSMTAGLGIKNVQNTYPNKLEYYLNEKLDVPKFKIINAGHPAWGTNNQLFDLFVNGFKFQPDMVFLGYYHNDIPRPDFLSCDAGEVELVTENGPLKNLLKQSHLYKFINSKINRLLEKMGEKQKFTDCINSTYSSIGWEMLKVNLDVINMACTIRNIKLMIGVIPLMHQLGDKYPIAEAHSKIMGYCKERSIECIDFYEDGFKGLDEKSLIISEDDRHLNADGAEVVARAIYKKLEPLLSYKHLPFIHRAFTLQKLLMKDETAKKLDRSFNQIKEEGTVFTFQGSLGLVGKTESELKVWRESGNFYFLKTIFDISGKIKAFTSRYVLDKTGEFINHTFNTFDLRLARVSATDFLETNGNRFIFTKISNQLGDKKIVQEKIYELTAIKLPEGGWSLMLGEGIAFLDPKSVINSALSNQSNSKNIKQTKAFYNILVSYYLNNWAYFADALIREVVKRNPSPSYLDAISKLYKETKQLSKLDELVSVYPKLNWPVR